MVLVSESLHMQKPMAPASYVPRAHHSSEPPLSPIASVRVLKRIPRACRDQAGLKPATVLEGVVSKNDVPAWERVLHFGTRCLRLTFPIDLRESQ